MKVFGLLFLLATAVFAQKFLGGGLHDVVYSAPRETLIKWAFAADAYHKKANNLNVRVIVGGLHDYINKLSNQEIAAYILREADEHPEINSKEFLDNLVAQDATNVTPSPIIGGDGGFHDSVGKASREELITWALTTEAYHREVNHQHLLGGLDDYINTLSNEEIVNYILKEVKEHPEIKSVEKLNSFSTKYNISSKSGHGPAAEEDFGINLPKTIENILAYTDRNTLMKYAIAAEKYDRITKAVRVMGGLHDYVNSMENSQIIDYIITKVGVYPELGSVEKLNSLVQEYKITDAQTRGRTPVGVVRTSNDDFGINLPDTIENKLAYTDRATLIKYALASEKYDRETKGIRLLGGLDDYVNRLSDEQIIAYIITKVGVYPELGNVDKLNGLVQKYGITETSGHRPVGVVRTSNDDFGINLPDTIENKLAYTDRATLIKYALATEKHDRVIKGVHLLGGLGDYVNQMTDEQIIAYIITKVGTYPEIGNVETLKGLVNTYKITDEQARGRRPVVKTSGDDLSKSSVSSGIESTDRDTLNKYAIVLQKYHRKANNQVLYGGIDDYVHTLSDSDVRAFVTQELSEHTEITSIDALNKLVTDFGVTGPRVPQVIGGGLHDTVRSLDRKSLIAFALAMDEYSHEKTPRLGGIDDYVYTLQDQEIANFILKQAEKYPELNSKSEVEQLIKKYNITVKSQ